MCTFITAVLPAEADRAAVAARLRAHRRGCIAHVNVSLQAQLKSGETACLTHHAHCDCGTPLGAALHARRSPEDKAAAAAERMRRKGWSEAKIARALSQQDEAVVRNTLAVLNRNDADTLGAAEWLACLRDLLDSGATAWIGLIHRDDDGALDASFALRGREHHTLSALDADALRHMRADTLHVIAP